MTTSPKEPATANATNAAGTLLNSRHKTMIQWCEPRPACDVEDNELDAHVMLRATVHDCINMQRRATKAAGCQTIVDDAHLLLDFIAIHWARVVEANAPLEQPANAGCAQTGCWKLNIMNTPTPKTDKLAINYISPPMVPADFARKLERENNIMLTALRAIVTDTKPRHLPTKNAADRAWVEAKCALDQVLSNVTITNSSPETTQDHEQP